MNKTRIWDLPLRLFHWLLVLAVVGLVITAEIGADWLVWHFRLGYLVLALLFFRVIWGFVGGYWSRFRQFIFSPSTIVAYLKGQDQAHYHAGHNPLGSLSVVALLVFLIFQVSSGLFTDDEISFFGPLVQFVSMDWVEKLSDYHKEVGKTILIILVVLHVLAILYYKHKKRINLITPMITGDKDLPQVLPSSKDNGLTRLLALVVFAVGLGIAYTISQL